MMEHRTWGNGVHKLEFVPPDIFLCHINGTVSVEEARMTGKVLEEEIKPNVERFYLITNLAPGVPGLSPEARKYFGSVKPYWKGSIVVVGGSMLLRAAANILLRAWDLLGGSKIPSRVVKTLDEAYAFVAELRASASGK